MTRIVRWHYLSSIAISTVFVLGALVASWSYEVPHLFAQTYNNIGGWAWSGNSGWISLNSLNTAACKPVCTAGNVGAACRNDTDCGGAVGSCNMNSCPLPYTYGLNLNIDSNQTTGSISGYAWSSSLGWICFGSTCAAIPNICTAGDADKIGKKCATGTDCGTGGSCSPVNNPNSCSSVLAPPNSGSCSIGFTCKGRVCAAVTQPAAPAPPLPDNTVGKKCSQDSDCDSSNCLPVANVSCQEASTADLSGWARELNLGASGWLSMSQATGGGTTPYGVSVKFDQCYSTNPNNVSPPPASGGYVACPVPPATDPNILDPNKKSTVFEGFAWSGSGTQPASPIGTGWVSFNYTPEVLFPYLYGGGGDVFSGRNISSLFLPPSDRSNAQYLVHIGGSSISSHFVSACADPRCKSIVPSLIVPSTVTPSATAPYSFKLGRFDFGGLCAADPATHLNKYGQTVVVGFPPSGALGGKVYCPLTGDDDLTIYPGQKVYATPSSPVNLTNGATSAESGAGTVVVYGNLVVRSDITYGSTPNPPPVGWSNTQLASLTWVVLGDVRVDPGVKNLAGTFVVLGRRDPVVKECTGTFAICTTTGTSGCTSGQCLEVQACNGTGLSGTATSPTVCLNDSMCGAAPKTCISPDPTHAGQVCSADSDCGVGGSCRSCQPKFVAKDSAGDLSSGYGKFLSCVLPGVTGATCDQNPLIVSGSVFARQFKLTRTYVNVSTHDPSEQFVSDGRLQLNPPPGMADFAKGLPVFSRQ